MALLLAVAVRLLPIGAILLVRQGTASSRLLVLAIVVTVLMVVINLYADYLRGAYAAREHNTTIADPIRARINQFAPLRIGLWIAYMIALILLLVVQ
jgi:hypothetical protein